MNRMRPSYPTGATIGLQIGWVILLALSLPAAARPDPLEAANPHAEHSHSSAPGAVMMADGSKLGRVDFAVTCDAAVQPRFERAVALLHSFEYDAARADFEQVAARDRDCAIAYWGIAMSHVHQLWAPPPGSERDDGKAAALEARRIGGRSLRERGFIQAINAYYSGASNHPERMSAYADAMHRLFVAHPQDVEVAAFHALALIATADPTDKEYPHQLQAGQILESFVAKNPDHPGLTHYIIHAYDNPDLASRALAAARQYALIAPDSAHALHMPSHIFERLGMWQDSIRMNLRSTQAARDYASALKLPGHWDEELHGLDFLLYAYLQAGDIERAREVRDYIGSITAVYPQNFKVAYVFAAAPARYALETRDWVAAARLMRSHDAFPWSNFIWEQAITEFANGYGKARLGDVPGAREKQLVLERIAADSQGMSAYRIERLKINALTIKAWIQFEQQQHEAAIRTLREAAQRESAMLIPDGQLVPVAESLGDMYLQLGRMERALACYEASLVKHRNRRAAIVGAITASQALDDMPRAQRYATMLDAAALRP